MNDIHTELWLALISLFSEEDLIRWRRRVYLRLPESETRYNLMTALDDELTFREVEHQIAVPPLESHHE
jgi:hypothetical protein